jgi:hypothetical protein
MIDEGMVIDKLDGIKNCLIQPENSVIQPETMVELALSKINTFLDSLTAADNAYEDYIEELMIEDMNSRLLENGHIYI